MLSDKNGLTFAEGLRIIEAGGDKPHEFVKRPKPDSHGDYYCVVCNAREPYLAHDKRFREPRPQ